MLAEFDLYKSITTKVQGASLMKGTLITYKGKQTNALFLGRGG